MFSKFYNTESLKSFYCPTRIFFGSNSRELIFSAISGDNKVVVIVDQFFENDQFVDRLRELSSNPAIIIVRKEPATVFLDSILAKFPQDITHIVAVGGGSTIDTAKAIAAYLGFGTYYVKDEEPVRPMPVVFALPTTAGTGAEVSRFIAIIDSTTGHKKGYRAWSIVPQFAVLDPYFLRKAPVDLIVTSAFDAFCHLWETFICKYERSTFNDIFVFEGMEKILLAMKQLETRVPDSDCLLSLLFASTMGGIAASNIRTGIIHSAGKALSVELDLSHGETLFVFFKNAVNMYYSLVRDREELLIRHLKKYPEMGFTSLFDIISFWEKRFMDTGVTSKIRQKLQHKKVNTSAVYNFLLNDTVLLKEHPSPLDRDTLRYFLEKTISEWKE